MTSDQLTMKTATVDSFKQKVTKQTKSTASSPPLLPGHRLVRHSLGEGGSLGKGRFSSVKTILFSFAFLVSFVVNLHAQTTLSGDHIVTGNLDVGDSTTKGNLKITGQTGGSALPGLKITGDGGVLFEGTFGTGAIPATGTGTRFMWYPKKAALRAGSASGTTWDDVNIGQYSAVLGSGVASGNYSIVLGSATALGHGSTAMGWGWADGSGSTAMSGGFAYGPNSVAMNFESVAYGQDSTAMSVGIATGDGSTAMSGGFADGRFSVAAGWVHAAAAYSFAIGRYSISEGSPTQWIDTEQLFVVANGTGVTGDPNRYRNALTVLKNGKMSLFGSSPTTPTIVLDPNTPQITVGGQPLLAPNGSGNLGIGTANPATKLEVFSAAPALRITDSTNTDWGTGHTTMGSIEFFSKDVNFNGVISSIKQIDYFGGSHTVPRGNLGFYVSNNAAEFEAMRISYEGYVGIGTATPAAKLNVYGLGQSIRITDSRNQAWPSGQNTAMGSVDFASADTDTPGVLSSIRQVDYYPTGHSYPRGNLHFFTTDGTVVAPSSVPKMVISYQGNVGVGTTTPQARLDVNGDSVLRGSVQITGAIQFARQGDILMGEFGPPEE